MIPVSSPSLSGRELEYVTDAVRSGWVSSCGAYIEKFESAFATFVGARHALAVSNGTVALHLALHAAGIGPGDEVIMPDLTFAATAHAALQVGAVPVLVDVEPDTWCMSPRAVERACSPKTKAIIAVHLYGHPADTHALQNIASSRGLLLLEDAAEAHGAKVGNQVVGSIGRVGAFSFYGNKIITTGEGGMVTTSDDELADRMRFLKDHGMSKTRRYFHSELAFNYRITNLQAALGLAQMEQIDRFIARKREIWNAYREGLSAVKGLSFNCERPGYFNVAWMTSIVLGNEIATDRDAVMAAMAERGVDSRPFFVPMSDLPHLAHCRKVGSESDDCPNAKRLGARGINLPSGTSLTDADVAVACKAIAAAVRG